MHKHVVLAAIVTMLTLSTSSFASADYEPFCLVEDGDAVAYLRNNTSSSVRVSGDIHFFFYDEDRDLIWDTVTPKSASIPGRSVGEVGSYGAPSDSVSCSVDMSDAIDLPSPSYSVFCELDSDGVATGFLRNNSSETIRISGRVKITWYDEDQDRIWDTTTTMHTRIQRGDVGEIGNYNGPDDAVSCSFDVSEAIE
jgi:hypothetical protein